MGFALSGAAGGAGETLQKILAQRFLEQIQRQKLDEDARQADMQHTNTQRGLDLQERSIDETSGLRQATLDASIQQRADANADRDAARATQDTNAFRETVKILPKGSRITGEQAVRFGKAGMSPMLKPATNSAGEPEFEFGGTQQTIDNETKAAETQRHNDLLNAVAEGRLSVAQLQAEIAKQRADTAAVGNKPSAEAQANEIADAIALVDQISNDKALSTAVGPIDAYIGKARDLSGVNRFESLHDNLLGKLQLAQAGKIKGQGPISNEERRMLSNAATALRRNLSEKDYKAELKKIRAFFERQQTGAATGGGGNTGGGATVGERRMVDGQLAEWDGKGWKAAK